MNQRSAISLLLAALVAGCTSVPEAIDLSDTSVIRIGSAPIRGLGMSIDRLEIAAIDADPEWTFEKAPDAGRKVPAGLRTVEFLWTNTVGEVPATCRASCQFEIKMKKSRTYLGYAERLDYGATVRIWMIDAKSRRVVAETIAKIHYSP